MRPVTMWPTAKVKRWIALSLSLSQAVLPNLSKLAAWCRKGERRGDGFVRGACVPMPTAHGQSGPASMRAPACRSRGPVANSPQPGSGLRPTGWGDPCSKVFRAVLLNLGKFQMGGPQLPEVPASVIHTVSHEQNNGNFYRSVLLCTNSSSRSPK